MNLTSGQKHFIRKNLRRTSIKQISHTLNVSEREVTDYLNSLNPQSVVKLEKKPSSLAFFYPLESFHFFHFFKKYRYFFLGLALVVVISYANSINDAFVSDDHSIESYIKTWTPITIFSKPGNFLRDVLYFITYHTVGWQPYAFRLWNIAFHVGAVWAAFTLLYLFSSSLTIAFVAAVFFAVHPMAVEAITWISGGSYVQYSFFFFVSLIFYILSKRQKKYFIFSVIAYSLSLFSSEKAIVLFLVFILYELCFGSIKKNWKKLAVILAINSLWLYVYFLKINERLFALEQLSYQHRQVYNPFIQVPIAIISYLQLFIWPDQLTLYHSELQFTQMQYFIRLVLFALIVTGILYMYFRNRWIFFWSAFFFIALLPTLTPFGISWIVAERYVYLSSLGLFAIVAFFTRRFFEDKRFKFSAITLLSIIIIACSVRIVIRNVDWLNEDNLWIATGRASPSSPNTHNNLGDVYSRHGDYQKAAEEFMEAIKLQPNYADVYHNLGNTYQQMGRPQDALSAYKKALSINPKLWQSHQNIAAIYFNQGKYDLALFEMKQAFSLNPDPSLAINLGIIYYKKGEVTKGIEVLQSVVNQDPANQRAQAVLAQMKQGK